MTRERVVAPDPPDELGVCEGLAYARFAPPAGAPAGAIVILHGAGSRKENHYDFARRARAAGLVAIALDLRGHGESEGALGAGAGEDVAAVAREVGDGLPVCLRGSSLGGYLALCAAGAAGARAVVAICPASADGLRRGVRSGRFEARIDAAGLDAYLREHDEAEAVASLEAALLLLHAEGDEVVPVAHSRALFARAAMARRRLVVVPGGDHRSLQHDEEIQALSLAFVREALSGEGAGA